MYVCVCGYKICLGVCVDIIRCLGVCVCVWI